ncbi:hypothetical protein [Microbacterium sp. Leaf159]|uniref:hypothetical protein n=1 Tax=Microbacterium sp. Leaf159 TaxID=1736279 RepID=UPI0006F3A8AC|nr:hypothetical protein [Microbacterium sp. Leaf159]KQR39219.1 hypothetical protein ASF80_07280 [Microbacterium sp. Leaf159]
MTENHEPLEGTQVSAIMRTLFMDQAVALTEIDKRIANASNEWQTVGSNAHTAELHATLSGAQEGRAIEIFGRAASAGEQLGLALTLSLDARRWLATEDTEVHLPVRALTEMQEYYTLAAAAGLANVILRIGLLHKDIRARIENRWKNNAGFHPFSGDRNDWIQFSERAFLVVRGAVDEADAPELQASAEALLRLRRDPRWEDLDRRRSLDYHQWRPQSIAGGVPAESLWSALADGGREASFPAASQVLPDLAEVCAESDAALELLGDTAAEIRTRFPTALREVGLAVYRSDDAT